MDLFLGPVAIPVRVQHRVDFGAVQAALALEHLPRRGFDLARGHPAREGGPELAAEARLGVRFALGEEVAEAGVFGADVVGAFGFAGHDAGEGAVLGVGENAHAEGVVGVDGVEGVDQVVADDGADLLRGVGGVAIDDVGGAVGAQFGFVAQPGGGDDGAEAGQSAGLHRVFAAVAACADDHDGVLAVIMGLLLCGDGVIVAAGWEGKWEIEAVGAEDGPERRDDIAD